MILSKSIVVAGAGLLMQTGAGCFAPTIIADDGNIVTLKYGPWATVSEIHSKADAICGEYDKIAELAVDVEDTFEPGFRYATFDCIDDDPSVT